MRVAMSEARSIDAAARGYVRHRFVRAFGASCIVAALFGILAAIGAAIASILISGNSAQLATLPLGLALAFVLAILPLVLLVLAVSAVMDVLHRRVVAAMLIALSLFVLVFTLGSIFASAMTFFGASTGIALLDAAWLLPFAALGSAIAYEMLRHGWWQLTSARTDFFAIRGWRPPPWRVFTTLRRQLGLPAFLSYIGKRRMPATLFYCAVAVLNLGLILLLILPTFFASMTETDSPLILALIVVIIGGLLAANLFGAGNMLAARADARAAALYQNVREWDVRAPILFLRAFDQDDHRAPVTGGDAFARWPAGVGRARTLDEFLLDHGSPYGPVIAIGDPRDPVPPLGAARVFVPEAGDGWQDAVRGLAGAARCVVMCPNHGEGVQWELDLIAQAGGRLSVIYLASPDLTRADTLALFQRLVPGMPVIAGDQRPIAAYAQQGAWRLLTARELSLNAYTAALNASLQAMFGLKGETRAPPSVHT